jgi:hypothetical protein
VHYWQANTGVPLTESFPMYLDHIGETAESLRAKLTKAGLT